MDLKNIYLLIYCEYSMDMEVFDAETPCRKFIIMMKKSRSTQGRRRLIKLIDLYFCILRV